MVFWMFGRKLIECLEISFRVKQLGTPNFLSPLGWKDWLVSTSSFIKWIVVIRGYLYMLNKSRKILPTPFNFLDLDGCSIIMECRGIASFSLGPIVLWKSLYLMAWAWIHCCHKWLSKFLFSRMSLANWYWVYFNFTTLPLHAWIEVIIWVSNNLLCFILTTSFGDKYEFLNSHCKDPFIVLFNVSWRPKWLSNRSWSSWF